LALIGTCIYVPSRFSFLVGQRVRRRFRRFVESHRERGPPHLQFA
jgi:hypothetical protein